MLITLHNQCIISFECLPVGTRLHNALAIVRTLRQQRVVGLMFDKWSLICTRSRRVKTLETETSPCATGGPC